MTPAEFRVRFPEFDATPDAMVTAHLAASELDVSDSWDDDQRDEIVALRTASSLATTPFGRNANLADLQMSVRRPEISTYDIQLKRLEQAHACCLNRVG